MAGGGMQNWGGMTPYGQASGAQAGALDATQQAMNQNAQWNPNVNPYDVTGYQSTGYDPTMQQGVGTIQSGMSTYQNPWQQQVVQNTAQQMERQRQMAQSQNAANASRAGAFGGARHGLTEAVTNAETARALGDVTGQLNMQGFNTAAGLAGQDIGNQMNINAANQNAANQASAFGAGNQNAANAYLAGQQNQANAWGAATSNANQQQQFNNALTGAGQMAQLGQGSFGYGNQINDQMMQQGGMGQNMGNQLMGQGAGMFNQYTQQPAQYLNTLLQSLGMNPLNNTGTQSSQYNPGLLDWAGLGAGVGGAYLGGKGGKP